MMTRFKIGRVALLSGCAFAGIIVPAHAQTAATATTESQPVEDAADPSTRDIVVTGTRVVRDGYNQPTPVTVAPTTELEKATPTNLADAINKLPQFANSVSPQSNSQLQGNSGEVVRLSRWKRAGPASAAEKSLGVEDDEPGRKALAFASPV